MTETTETVKRPASITVICVVGFVGALVAVSLIFSPAAQKVGSWYPPYLAISALLGLTCTIGLWLMKKWAVYTYIGVVALNQIVILVMGVWNVMALLIPAVVIFFALKHVSKMS